MSRCRQQLFAVVVLLLTHPLAALTNTTLCAAGTHAPTLGHSVCNSCPPGYRCPTVGVINASPTGMGLLTERGVPDWHPASTEIVAACRRAAQHCRARGGEITQLAVQFACSHADIATTLVGTALPENMRRNLAYLKAPIDQTLLAEVHEILSPIQNCNFTRGRVEHRDPLLMPAVAA